MIFKFRHRLLGGHVHIRMFAGTNPHALGKCGDLTMRPEEWDAFRARTRLSAFTFVDDYAAQPADTNQPLDMP